MEQNEALKCVYGYSDEIVSREIQDELIIVPLVGGIGDLEDELYTLNESGKEIWNHLDGKKTLQEIVHCLCGEYDAPEDEIARDVLGLTQELCQRKFLVTIKQG